MRMHSAKMMHAPKDSDAEATFSNDDDKDDSVSNDADNGQDEDVFEPVLIYQSDATKKAEHQLFNVQIN